MSDDDLKKQLEEIKNQITQVRLDMANFRVQTQKFILANMKSDISRSKREIADFRISELRHARSEFSLYFSIFLSAVIGVLGNWYVSLLFQPPSEAVNTGLSLASWIAFISWHKNVSHQ